MMIAQFEGNQHTCSLYRFSGSRKRSCIFSQQNLTAWYRFQKGPGNDQMQPSPVLSVEHRSSPAVFGIRCDPRLPLGMELYILPFETMQDEGYE